VAGAPEQIADRMQEWAENRAADGFNVMPSYLTGGFDIFRGRSRADTSQARAVPHGL
jgi:alkanesulfonate monooxygenase SsuD/methylene tetrahydromethanopterin reductase-like flavin-dependent oxidoreductase (luciferase family)